MSLDKAHDDDGINRCFQWSNISSSAHYSVTLTDAFSEVTFLHHHIIQSGNWCWSNLIMPHHCPLLSSVPSSYSEIWTLLSWNVCLLCQSHVSSLFLALNGSLQLLRIMNPDVLKCLCDVLVSCLFTVPCSLQLLRSLNPDVPTCLCDILTCLCDVLTCLCEVLTCLCDVPTCLCDVPTCLCDMLVSRLSFYLLPLDYTLL